MDHMMPDMDGVETAKRIRATGGYYAASPIIALTANAVSGAREIFLRAGMNDFIPKPIDPKKLNAMLVKWLPSFVVKDSEIEILDKAAAEASGEASGSVDLKEGLKNAIGDEAFYSELATNFLADHSSDCDKINEALSANNTASARRIAHTLKSTAAMIGARKLRDLAEGIEHRLSAVGASPVKIDCGELERELQSVKNELKPFVLDAHAPLEISYGGAAGGNIGSELMDRLAPLLKSGDTKSLDFVDEIKRTFGFGDERSKLLAEQIEAFDFSRALETLDSMRTPCMGR
jgi:HPt (histidine-containing phosphotransfer) domain-containing protein